MRVSLLVALLFAVACGNSGKTQSTECRVTCQGSDSKVQHFDSCHFEGEEDAATAQRAEEKCAKDADDGTCQKPTCTCTLFDQTAPKDCSE